MIKLQPSSSADSRTANHKVTERELLKNSQQHIADVVLAMVWMADMLIKASYNHDWTKIKYIEDFYHDFAQSQDGFQGDFKQEHWFKDLHLQERHHLTARCPDDVNLFDVLERIADGVTAGMARSGEIYEDDLSPEILMRAYKNTMKLLKDEIVIEK